MTEQSIPFKPMKIKDLLKLIEGIDPEQEIFKYADYYYDRLPYLTFDYKTNNNEQLIIIDREELRTRIEKQKEECIARYKRSLNDRNTLKEEIDKMMKNEDLSDSGKQKRIDILNKQIGDLCLEDYWQEIQGYDEEIQSLPEKVLAIRCD